MILPPISVPVVDPKSGRMTDDWYAYFEALMRALEAAGIDVD